MRILTFLLVATCNSAYGQWQFQSGEVNFYIKNAGFNVDGKFTQIQASIRFNPDQPKETFIEANVEAASISTGIGMRDKHLKKEDYFDVIKFPRIMLTITFDDPGKLMGDFTINRRDFNIGGNSWMMSNNVEVKLTAQLKKNLN